MSSITDFILGFSVTLLETLIFKATHKKLAYIYSSQEEAFLAFAAMAYSVAELGVQVQVDFDRFVIINKRCRYEEHFLSNDCFIKSDEPFFRCLAYSPMCDNATEKYYSINVRKS